MKNPFKLTPNQKQFLSERKIEVGGIYMFPQWGFTIYERPSYTSGMYVDLNPFTKALPNDFFKVKEISGSFCRGNFHKRPSMSDAYMSINELAKRGIVEYFFLLLICYLPMVIVNIFKRPSEPKPTPQTPVL